MTNYIDVALERINQIERFRRRLEPTNQNEVERKLALERTHQDYKAGQESHRTTAQYVMLINGGAATAILASSSRADGVGIPLVADVPISLIGYAIGVSLGAAMMYALSIEQRYWGDYWTSIALPGKGIPTDKSYHNAERWKRFGVWIFRLSILSFVASSLWIAVKMLLRHRYVEIPY